MCPNNNTLVQVCGSKSDSSINGNFSVSCPSKDALLPMNTMWTVSALIVNYRLKIPGFSDFRTYMDRF